MYISIFITYIFLETSRKMKNAVKTTKFRVVPPRKVPYVHVSHGNCDGKMNDIYTSNYVKIIAHISIFRKSNFFLNFVGLNILFLPLSRDNPRSSGNSAYVLV